VVDLGSLRLKDVSDGRVLTGARPWRHSRRWCSNGPDGRAHRPRWRLACGSRREGDRRARVESPLCVLALAVSVSAWGESLTLSSPSAKITVTVDVAAGRALYSVTYGGREVIRPSALGLGLEGAARLDSEFQMTRHVRRRRESPGSLRTGSAASIRTATTLSRWKLREAVAPARTLVVEFRAYDEGVALRYHVPAQAGLESFVIGDELTEFRLPAGAFGWATPRAQTPYERVAVERMTQASERPFLVELPEVSGRPSLRPAWNRPHRCSWRTCAPSRIRCAPG